MDSSTKSDDPVELDGSGNEVIQIKELEGVYDNLVIDISGEDDTLESETAPSSNDDSVQLIESIPSYHSDFSGYLTDKEFCMETGKHLKNDARPKKTCFNCLGDHNISECPEPHNPANIRKNKMSIMGGRTNNRYHQDMENKFGQLQPGRISSRLRYALGLRSDEAPRFIYRMRYLGYPLGWLKEAEVVRAQVALIDGDGKVLSHPEEEEGEADSSHIKYNPEKLIEFPGFNIPFESHIKEESHFLQMPPMNPLHSKSEFERIMKGNRATKYKRKKLQASHAPNHSLSQPPGPPPSDMDIENGEQSSPTKIETNLACGESINPPLPPPLPEQPPPPPPEEEAKEEGELSDDSNSSERSTKALTTTTASDASGAPAKNKLQDTLTLEDSSSNDLTRSADVSSETRNVTTTNSADASAELQDVTTASSAASAESQSASTGSPADITESRSAAPKRSSSWLSEDNSDSQSSESSSTTKRHHRSSSKGFSLGVSVPESITPFRSLPHPDKWAVEISDHINFENLPDALGTWNKMKDLVTKVKKRMSDLHAED